MTGSHTRRCPGHPGLSRHQRNYERRHFLRDASIRPSGAPLFHSRRTTAWPSSWEQPCSRDWRNTPKVEWNDNGILISADENETVT
jgi:hypothetical protein